MKKMAITNIPGRPPIELPAYYEYFAWYYPNCEMQTKAWFVKNAQPDWIYLDCGANIGYYSILFSQLSPLGTIHAVEPTSTAAMLEENLNHHQCRNVTLHKLALGQYPGRRVDKIFRIWGEAPEESEYDFTTVDQLVGQLGLPSLNCLKIDVDSFDFEVLMGAEKVLKRFDPWVVVELNHALNMRGYTNVGALAWLRDHGYRHCLVLDLDNFLFRRSAPASAFASKKSLRVNFQLS